MNVVHYSLLKILQPSEKYCFECAHLFPILLSSSFFLRQAHIEQFIGSFR